MGGYLLLPQASVIPSGAGGLNCVLFLVSSGGVTAFHLLSFRDRLGLGGTDLILTNGAIRKVGLERFVGRFYFVGM
jgi:hypothetical protein